ncbi:MAG: hypothetical protein L0I24_15430, partial [Pseudonocardia sp.]|nr:hypothetical protein [Pseudonocardia sp.]
MVVSPVVVVVSPVVVSPVVVSSVEVSSELPDVSVLVPPSAPPDGTVDCVVVGSAGVVGVVGGA